MSLIYLQNKGWVLFPRPNRVRYEAYGEKSKFSVIFKTLSLPTFIYYLFSKMGKKDDA